MIETSDQCTRPRAEGPPETARPRHQARRACREALTVRRWQFRLKEGVACAPGATMHGVRGVGYGRGSGAAPPCARDANGTGHGRSGEATRAGPQPSLESARNCKGTMDPVNTRLTSRRLTCQVTTELAADLPRASAAGHSARRPQESVRRCGLRGQLRDPVGERGLHCADLRSPVATCRGQFLRGHREHSERVNRRATAAPATQSAPTPTREPEPLSRWAATRTGRGASVSGLDKRRILVAHDLALPPVDSGGENRKAAPSLHPDGSQRTC